MTDTRECSWLVGRNAECVLATTPTATRCSVLSVTTAVGVEPMTAELWLHKPCIGCGDFHPGSTKGYCDGPGGSSVRLNPDKVVFTIPNDTWGRDDEYTVKDVIDALEEE